MRVFTAVLIWLVLVEVLLGLGFLAGYYWVGGWQMGVLVAAAVLLLMLVPWLGELRAEYDSEAGGVEVKVGWWGRVRLRRKPEPTIEVRACGIPWRRKLGEPKRADEQPADEQPADEQLADEQPAEEAAPEKPVRHARARWHVGPENIDDLVRAALSALAAGNDLIWDAREVHLQVDSPSQQQTPDDIIGKVVGHRGVGPLDLKLTAGDGERRIRARYRIGLFRAMVISVCMAFQGRVWALRGARRQADEADAASTEPTDEDRELIEQLQEQLEEREHEKEDD